MRFDQGEFQVRKFFRFFKDLGREADLSDVMDRSRHPEALPLLLAAAALLPICGFDLLSMDNDMPAALQDDDKGLGRGDFGWFLCGIWLTFAWSCPLVLARHSVLSMRISWFTSIGTWGLIGTVAGLLVFFIKGRSSSDSSVWL